MSDPGPGPTTRAGPRTRAIVFGLIGATLGFVAAGPVLAMLPDPSDRADIATHLIRALLVLPPCIIGGLLLGVAFALRGEAPGQFTRHALAAGAWTLGAIGIIGGGVIWYMVATATPWLKPSMTLEFEVRLPAGTKAPAGAREVKLELQTDLNTMPGELREVRNEADRAVLVGKVELMYRTRYRQIEVKVAGQNERVFPLKLPASPPAAPELGGWEKQPDGSEIRYRAR